MSSTERKSKSPRTSPVADAAGDRKLRHADTGTEFSVNVQRSAH
jgi:hypothetical protein